MAELRSADRRNGNGSSFALTSRQITLGTTVFIGLLIVSLILFAVGYEYSRIGFYMLGGMLALGLAIAIVLRPELGAFVLTFTIYTNIADVLGSTGILSINKVLVLLVAVSLLGNRLLGGQNTLKLGRTELLLAAYGFVQVLTFFVAQNKEAVVTQSINFAKDFIILLCIIYALESFEAWKRVGWILIVTAALLSLLGAYQVATGNYTQTFGGLASHSFESGVVGEASASRLAGPVGDPNYFGQILVAVLPLAVYRALRERKLLKVLAAGCAFLILFAIIYTYSRGAFLATMAALTAIVIERKMRLWALLPILLVGLLVALVLPTGYLTRIQTISLLGGKDESSVYEDASLRGRTSELLAGLYMWADHPLLGVGVGNYRFRYQEYASQIGLEARAEEREAHSLYIEILAETGLAGVATFGAYLVSLFAALRGAAAKLARLEGQVENRHWLVSTGVGVGAYLVSSIFLHGAYFRYLMLLIALAIAAVRLTDQMAAGERAEQPSEAELI